MMKLTNRNIPLDRLSLSPANVRTAKAHPDEDTELQASILALGVLESLLVHADGDDRFHVVAGGRRLAALQQLAGEKRIPHSYVVPCRIVADSAKLVEISLHENEMRAAMHPADQFEAFARLRDDGMTAAEIAARAGVSERQVTKLMRLAAAAPELIAAYRNEQMNLETLMAFTVTDDHQAQKDVWRAAKHSGMTWPQEIRTRLTKGAVSGGTALARFVGIDTYEAAGGRVQRDLFTDGEHGTYLTDRALLTKLAEAQLQKTADRLAKQWKWAEVAIDPDWDRIHTLHRLTTLPPEPTAAERKRLEKIDAEIETAAKTAGDDPAGQGSRYARAEELSAQRERIEVRIAGREKYRASDTRIAGCLVYLEGAQRRVLKGLVLPADLPAKPKKRKKANADGEHRPEAAPETANEIAASGDGHATDEKFDNRFEEPWATSTGTRYVSPEAKHAKETGLSTAAVDDLAAIRTGIVRAALAKRFDVAFDLAAFLMIRDAGTGTHTSRAADIRLGKTSLRPMGRDNERDFADANPGEQLYQHPQPNWAVLDAELDQFDAFRALDNETKHSLFAQAVAASLYNQAGVQHRVMPIGERVVELLDIDFAAAVRPTDKYFWRRLTRAQLLEIAESVVGPEWAKARRKHKKGELTADMATVFAADPQGRAALEPDARERIERWAMPGFRPWDSGTAKPTDGGGE